MSRSLLSQLEQIAGSLTYNDLVDGFHTGAVAEPPDSTISGSLEYDLNLVRAHIREIKDYGGDWFAGLSTYTAAFDGSTVSGSLANIVTPTHGTGNVLDAKSVIMPVDDDNSGSGFTTATGTTGFLLTVSTQYADAADRRGLPIYASTGTYYDEGGSDNIVRIDLLDTSTGNEFVDSSGNVIFARFHDGADNGGSGDGVDAWVAYYTVSGAYTWTAGDPSSISIVYPQRKIMSEMNEWEWFRTDFVSGFEGDVELIEDIENLWSFTGSGDGITSPTWTNTTAYYLLDGNPSDLEAAINDINDGVGDRDYTSEYYVTDGQSITASIDALDQAIYTITSSGIGEKYVYSTSSAITAGTPITLPYSITYTPNSSDTQPGANMDIYVDGQLLAADYATLGLNDYAETSSNQWTPHFTIRAGANITYVVRV